MSNEDLRATIDAIEKVNASLPTREEALAFLVELGIATPAGELTENYQQQIA